MDIDLYVDIQVAEDLDKAHPFFKHVTTDNITYDLNEWYLLALTHIEYAKAAECTIRLVSPEESQALNSQYRHKNKPTNVLSFPSEIPDFVESSYIGDMVICIDAVISEADAQNKAVKAHFQHLCIHGLLHLLGYDHIENNEAKEMEGLEIAILNKLGIDDPYNVQ